MINKVILVGNVGADPEVHSLENNVKVARLNLATTERFTDRQTQQVREQTEWHRVVFWRGLADVVDRYVRKGSQIYVEGKIRNSDYTDKDGVKRYSYEIVADELKLLGRRDSQAPAAAPQPAPAQPVQAPAYQAQPVAPVQPATPDIEPEPNDLPF